jgi:competence protein ComGB
LALSKKKNMTAGCMKMNEKWSREEQAIFLQRTGELLARGYTLSEALESLTYYFSKSKQKTIHHCLVELKEGYPLHQILTNLKFNKSLVGYVYFAEQHGGLAEAFKDGSAFMLRRNRDVRRIIRMLNYPALLSVITAILFFFVEQVLLPRFTEIFASMNLEQNGFSHFIALIGELVPILFFSAIVCLFALYCYFQFVFRSLSPLEKRNKIVKIPGVGSFFRIWYTHYFAVQMGYLLSGGLSVLEALTIFEKNLQQPLYVQICQMIKEKLSKGERLDAIVASLSLFEKELAQIIKHGQAKGKLSQELSFYSGYCVLLLEEKIEKWLKIIQPLLYLFIGSIIVSMYLAILLPMFHMLEGL